MDLSRRNFLAGIAAAAVVTPAMVAMAHGEPMVIYISRGYSSQDMIDAMMATTGNWGVSHQWELPPTQIAHGTIGKWYGVTFTDV